MVTGYTELICFKACLLFCFTLKVCTYSQYTLLEHSIRGGIGKQHYDYHASIKSCALLVQAAVPGHH